MNLFPYREIDTFIHRLDPRTKIAGVALLFAMALTFNHPLWLLPITVLHLIVGWWSGSWPNYWRFRFILVLLFVFSSAMWPFFVEGPTPLFELGPLEASRESLLFGLAMGLRLATILMAGLIFLTTTRIEEFSSGLPRLGVPYPMAFAFATALRLVPTFAGAGATIIQAQVSRGLELEKVNVFQRAAHFVPLAVPLFIYGIRHTNLLAMALESKGFNPAGKRTHFVQLRMGARDWLVLLVLAALAAGLVWLRLQGYGVVLPGRL